MWFPMYTCRYWSTSDADFILIRRPSDICVSLWRGWASQEEFDGVDSNEGVKDIRELLFRFNASVTLPDITRRARRWQGS